MRERHFIQGKYWDVVCMAVLRSDYDLIKEKIRIRELLNSPWNYQKKSETAIKFNTYLVLAVAHSRNNWLMEHIFEHGH